MADQLGTLKFNSLKSSPPTEVEGIDNASVIIRHLSVGITAETVIKPTITNSLNLVHTKKMCDSNSY